MSKDEKCTCKACKNTIFHCQICKCVGLLLPSSSWLLKFPNDGFFSFVCIPDREKCLSWAPGLIQRILWWFLRSDANDLHWKSEKQIQNLNKWTTYLKVVMAILNYLAGKISQRFSTTNNEQLRPVPLVLFLSQLSLLFYDRCAVERT